ncbi:hypothetical protein BDZ94DRAFT_1141563, partial [Collybia nuda]
SIYNLYPHVEAGILLDIAWYEFKPMDLYKLDSQLHDKTDLQSMLDFGDSTLTVKACAGPLRDYPSLHSLHIPLFLYFDILLIFAASGGDTNATCLVMYSAFQYLSHCQS